MATLRSRRKDGTRRARRTSPSPITPPWTPRPALFGWGVHHNVAIPMSDGIALRADIHYPTVPEAGLPAAGPFPVLLCLTPYGRRPRRLPPRSAAVPPRI
jgi:predicted acyl esterase